jgi:putative spermidine/putrescine transport system ATP-binding protein
MSQDVELDGVDLTLSGNKILSGIDLKIEAGSFTTLLGPSGSGKSTTLNVIAGFLRPDAGSVRFGGNDVQGLPPGSRGLGIVFQNYAIFPHMTIGENVMFPLKAQKWKGDRRARVGDMLDLVKLNGFENRRASTLSGGQLQRVALARALAPNPQVLLLDEPLSALDKQLREQMQSELKSIQREIGVTTISVTHDQAEALALSDQVVVMNHGEIVQCGTAHELYGRPVNEFLARFLGEVNLVPIGADGYARPVIPQRMATTDGFAMARPEDFRVATDRATTPGAFQACVTQVQFQGGTCRAELDVDGLDEQLVVRLPYEGVERVPVVGGLIDLVFRKSDVHVVPSAGPVDTTTGIRGSTSVHPAVSVTA